MFPIFKKEGSGSAILQKSHIAVLLNYPILLAKRSEWFYVQYLQI